MIKNIAQKILLLVSIGTIIVSFSEFFFYRVGDINIIGISLFYGIIGYLFLIALSHYKVAHFSSMFIAACLFGFLIEGVFVPVLYEAIPFSIIWTSMAWHALISISVGWYLFRQTMIHKSLTKAILVNLFIGVFLGVWGAYSWSAIEGSSADIVVYKWVSTTIYAKEFLIGFALFIAGHLIWDHLQPSTLKNYLIEFFGCALFILYYYIAGQLLTIFPASLILIPLIGLCLFILHRQMGKQPKETIINTMLSEKIPLKRYFLALIIPFSGIGSYALLFKYDIQLETNAILFFIAGPLSLFLFIKGSLQTIKNPLFSNTEHSD